MATQMDKITVKDVEKLAKLARLGLSDKEKESFATQMTEILGYVKQLDEIETGDVEPTSQVTGLKNIMADDGIRECLVDRDQLLSNAPESENGFIKVTSTWR
jgi:aspartyl-tRNA(Asn)/glutamyl-tRNA(Gln) amidotransferase subunit C